MFIKVTSSAGKRYAQLVESFRNEAGQPRQRMVASLGRLEPGGEVDRLIAALQRAQGRDAQSVGGARVGELTFEGAYAVGDVWVLWQLWRKLGLDGLALSWRRSRSQLDVLACLRAMVFQRLCDPGSKLGMLRWLQTVALPLGFGFTAGLPSHQEVLRAMDVLDEHADALHARLAVLLRPLIDDELSVVFYDLTTVQVWGEQQLADDVRCHGMGKAGLVQRQFMLSLVQTADGLPIAHEVHAGNIAETKTLLPMIEALLARYPLKRVVLVADRGLLSLNNLEQLEALQQQWLSQGRDVRLEYILAVPAARYGEFEPELRAKAAQHNEAQCWVDETQWVHEQRVRRLVIAHDCEVAQRRSSERQRRIDEMLALGDQWAAKLDAQDQGAKNRGRPLSDSGVKARYYHAIKEANLAQLIELDLRDEVFRFELNEQRQRYLELLDGKLLLVTNTDAPASEVLSRYKSLADIERGFRALKSDIEIGPVYHRLPQRIRAHALVCFIALILHRVLRMRLKAQERTESPMRLLEQLRRVQQQCVRTPEGMTLRGLSELTPEQKDLLNAIELPIPTPADLSSAAL